MGFQFLGLWSQNQPAAPIIVKIAEPPSELAKLSDVLLNSLGLTGALALMAILLGAIVGGAIFWIRKRSDDVDLKPLL